MNDVRTIVPEGRLESRPGRRALVAASLAELQGPTAGIVELPQHLFWNPDRSFCLDLPGALTWMYRNVLREASSGDDLAWLNGRMLAEVWAELFLPRGVRQAWEQVHPELTAVSAAALAP